jgi:hypothetical protein
MTMTDRGEPGSADSIGITVWNGAGTQLLFSSCWNGTKTVEQVLGGGNIQIQSLSSQPLVAAAVPTAARGASSITTADLQPALAEAVRWWERAGMDGRHLADLEHVRAEVIDLPGTYLGLAYPGAGLIQVDTDAAGFGWYVDQTPWDDSEYRSPGDPRVSGRMDLASALAHEMGHVIGLDDDHNVLHGVDLMYDSLAAGIRREPTAKDVQFVTPASGEARRAERIVFSGRTPFPASLGDQAGTTAIPAVSTAGGHGHWIYTGIPENASRDRVLRGEANHRIGTPNLPLVSEWDYPSNFETALTGFRDSIPTLERVTTTPHGGGA